MNGVSTGAPDGATMFTNNDDPVVLAWGRRAAAFAKLPELRPEDDNDDYTPAEQEQWDIIDAAEKVMQSSVATSSQGAEVQLWVNLYYLFLDNEQVEATHRRDIDWFTARDEQFDWSERMVLASIRSLRAMGGAK